jgi:tetratricopeptide (TPR) repeat protein
MNMKTDLRGVPVTGADATSLLRYETALTQFQSYVGDPVATIDEAIAASPAFVAAHLFKALVLYTLAERKFVPMAAAALRDAKGHAARANLRERGLIAATDKLIAGDWHGASQALDRVMTEFPRDAFTLQIAHLMDFFQGDALNLRNRISRVLPDWDATVPGYSYVLGMHAFGLEESGSYGHAEATGLAALDRNPDDVWALHAVVHTYEMRGQVDDGIRFLRSREADWASNNLFTVHNSWHLALFMLEAGRPDEALRVYDAGIHNESSDGVPLEMLDASALLWRLAIDGVDTGGRFGPLADAWATRVGDEPWYAFNDLHAVMAFVGAGRLDDARAVVDRLTRYVTASPSHSSNVMMTADVGLPAARAVLAFAEDRHGDVIDELMPVRRISARFGGSHAQRDALQRTLLESTIRAGRLDLARALLSERLTARDTSVYGWRQQARVLRAAGDSTGAAAAESNAAAHQARFARHLA